MAFIGTWIYKSDNIIDIFKIKNNEKFERLVELKSGSLRWYGYFRMSDNKRNLTFTKTGLIIRNIKQPFNNWDKIIILDMKYYMVSMDTVMLDNLLYVRTY